VTARGVLVAAALALTIVGCGDDSEDGEDGAAPSVTTDAGGVSGTADGSAALDDLPTYDTLDDIVDELDAGGIPCELEYDGLEDEQKTVSLCTIEGAQATLNIWKEPATVAELVGSGAATELTVYGRNWTIDLRDPAAAAAVAAALGGRTG
jgi:hypothetical protein